MVGRRPTWAARCTQAYLQATTASFAAIVACQIGTAFAARTQHSALRPIGPFSNPLLLGGIAFELLFAAAVIYLPPLQAVFGTAALPPWVLATLVPMPVLVWGVDEAFRAVRRRRGLRTAPSAGRVGPAGGSEARNLRRNRWPLCTVPPDWRLLHATLAGPFVRCCSTERSSGCASWTRPTRRS